MSTGNIGMFHGSMEAFWLAPGYPNVASTIGLRTRNRVRWVTGDDAQEQFDMIQPVPVNVIIEYRHQKNHDETDEIPQLWPFITYPLAN